MERIAWALVLIGALVIVGYLAFYSFDEFFKESGIPIPVKAAVPVALVGTMILIAMSLRDRILARRNEDFRKDDT